MPSVTRCQNRSTRSLKACFSIRFTLSAVGILLPLMPCSYSNIGLVRFLLCKPVVLAPRRRQSLKGISGYLRKPLLFGEGQLAHVFSQLLTSKQAATCQNEVF